MSPPLLAFGILNLPMLGWLVAAAAPILIHLWSRRKYREMSWAAMEYLLAAMKRRARRVQLEQWILLVIRTLLVVFIVLAVSEPYLERAGLASMSRGQTHRVLVLDSSYSMAFRPTDKSRFDRAKELAARIVEESPQGDAFTLVLMAAPPQVIVGTPALDKKDVLQEIVGVQLLHTTADLPATVAALQELIERAVRENPRLEQHAIYFLTDLGRVGWLPQLSSAAMADFRRRSQELSEAATLVVIDVGQPSAENLAITALRALDPVAAMGQKVRLEAVLKQFGAQARPKQNVDLLVDGRKVTQSSVDLAAGGEATVEFSYVFETPGDHVVEVRAEGDALDVDNHRWLALPVRQSIRVLCVDGRPSGDPFRGATGYLAHALAPPNARGQQTVHVDVAAESALLEQDLGRYDAVFLCGVAQFTANEARVLDAYLRNGGSVAFFLGDGVLADRYNRQLGGMGGEPRLLPALLENLVREPQSRLDPLGYRHPMVQAFRGERHPVLPLTPVSKHYKLALAKPSRARVVLALGNGDPLVVEEPIRRGRVVLVATSADTSWTPMPLWPSYVPLVQEMLAFCIGGQLQRRNVEVGTPLEGSVTGAADATGSVQEPDGRTRPLRLQSEGDYSTFTHPETWISGIYTVRLGTPGARSQTFAVNVDTAESDLTPLGIDQLRNEVWPDIDFHHQTTWQDLDRAPAATIGHGSGLPLGLLYGVLALLLTETVLAWRFGHHAP